MIYEETANLKRSAPIIAYAEQVDLSAELIKLGYKHAEEIDRMF